MINKKGDRQKGDSALFLKRMLPRKRALSPFCPLCLIFVLGFIGGVAAGENLSFSLSFDKSEYSKADPILLNFTLKNKGKKPVYVNNRFYLNSETSPKEEREVYLSVISPAGEKLPCKINSETGLPRTDNFILLQPGEETSMKRERNVKYYFDFEKSGIYKIKAYYQNVYGEEIGVDAFKGKIVSKEAKIKIVKDAHDE